MVDGIIPEAAGLQDLSGLGKEAAHLARSVGVGAPVSYTHLGMDGRYLYLYAVEV